MNDVNRIKLESAQESAQERAIYNSPDNVFDWSWPKVPRHKFLREKKKAYDFDKKSLIIPLDISDVLSTPLSSNYSVNSCKVHKAKKR